MQGLDDPAAADRIAPVPRNRRQEAIDLLHAAYCSDPAFARLYGLADEQLDGLRPIFHGIRAEVDAIPGTMLGCHRNGVLVGVIIWYPDLRVPLPRLLCKHPVSTIVALLHSVCVRWCWRPRLGPEALERWRAYGRLAREQSPQQRCLHVLALGVAASARRSGVARRLLAAVEADPRWRRRVECVRVDTWDPQNVSVYRQLGFATVAHGRRNGVECWTMLRTVAAAR